VTWSITSAHAAATTISGSGLLSVAAGEGVGSLTIRAASTEDNSKYDEETVTVTGDIPTGDVSVTINFEESAEDIDIEREPGDDILLLVASAGDYSDFQWVLDGMLLDDETTGTITIDTELLDIGPHRVTVIAVKAGISYSREIQFRVDE
jgi:hypothetical protein